MDVEEPAKVKKSSKKREAAAAAEVQEEKPAKKTKKAKEAAPEVEEAAVEEGPAPAPAAAPVASLDDFELSAPVKSILRSQGIASLFPIQAMALPPGLKGKGVCGCACMLRKGFVPCGGSQL